MGRDEIANLRRRATVYIDSSNSAKAKKLLDQLVLSRSYSSIYTL